jgi:uncharacterized protein
MSLTGGKQMQIIILADTHMPRMAKVWPAALLPYLERADHIVHAGDFNDQRVLASLQSFAPVTAVYGNTDGPDITEILPEKQVVSFQGVTVGITHGHGKGKTTAQRARAAFAEESLDLLIYGHSHIPEHQMEEEMVLFNPGSPTDKRRQEQFSFGVLIIEEDNIWTIKHIYYSDKKG